MDKLYDRLVLPGIRIFWLIGSYHDDGTNHQLSGLPG